jgi:nitrate reductase alpha subunit
MTEARYRGQKVIAVAPDYAENVKFADEWVSPAPGTDGALAMAMGHVILTEHFTDAVTPFFADYTKRYTDLPHLVCLDEVASGDGSTVYRPAKYLVAGDMEAGRRGCGHRAGAHSRRSHRPSLRRRGSRALEPRPRGHRPRAHDVPHR